MKAVKTLAAIDKWLEDGQDRKHRNHLGASLLGGKCMRKIWYGWRWAAKELFEGQMLRLFDRGEKEEDRFFDYLRGIGCQTWQKDPSTGKQFRVSFANGHGGGSCDGVAIGSPDLPEGMPFLVECKTHNDKSFSALVKEGLCQSKPDHFAQTQTYTVKLELPVAIYMAVNKNTDDLHLEIIWPNPNFVGTLMDRADAIVASETAPPRISNNRGFYYCKSFGCPFYSICFDGVAPAVNCRTCKHVKPESNGVWRCTRYDYLLTPEQQHAGCTDYHLKPGISDIL
jgi:hypothetical protein